MNFGWETQQQILPLVQFVYYVLEENVLNMKGNFPEQILNRGCNIPLICYSLRSTAYK